jgi:hypothetical protein
MALSSSSSSPSSAPLRSLLWLLLLVALPAARSQKVQSSSLRGGLAGADPSPSSAFEEQEYYSLGSEEEEEEGSRDDVEGLEEEFSAAAGELDPPLLIPAATAEYRTREGGYEIVVHEIPVQLSEDGEEWDPWMQLAIENGIDLDDYNVTYEDGTWETLEEDHRRNLVQVSGPAANNARFCNYERQRRGLRRLSWGADLIQQAQMQAAYMARIRRIAHRANLAAGIYAGWGIITENVCQNGNVGYNGAHRTLMNDVGHRNNILNGRLTKIGIGVSRNGT